MPFGAKVVVQPEIPVIIVVRGGAVDVEVGGCRIRRAESPEIGSRIELHYVLCHRAEAGRRNDVTRESLPDKLATDQSNRVWIVNTSRNRRCAAVRSGGDQIREIAGRPWRLRNGVRLRGCVRKFRLFKGEEKEAVLRAVKHNRTADRAARLIAVQVSLGRGTTVELIGGRIQNRVPGEFKK